MDDHTHINASTFIRSFFVSKDYFPGHAGCYHLLGFTLYVLNELEDAQTVLDIGSMVDPGYEPIQGKLFSSVGNCWFALVHGGRASS
jgi:hypothetical protein